MRLFSIAALSSLLIATVYAHAIESRVSHLGERTLCIAGTEPASGGCQSCAPGYFSLGGATRCQACPAGSTSSAVAAAVVLLPMLAPLALRVLSVVLVPVVAKRAGPTRSRTAVPARLARLALSLVLDLRPALVWTDNTGADLNARRVLPGSMPEQVRMLALNVRWIPIPARVPVLVLSARLVKEATLVRRVWTSASTNVRTARSTSMASVKTARVVLTPTATNASTVLPVQLPLPVQHHALLVLVVRFLRPTASLALSARAIRIQTGIAVHPVRLVRLLTLVRARAVLNLPSALNWRLEPRVVLLDGCRVLFCQAKAGTNVLTP
ncbi:unnamed protein product [Rhizoctonia solani]|uniref:Tyrosine-protein kinase ephrin type A/B receptor-like domain-containing protein n=1 Tax=Rhizoctonia solani TaxID=456999 RepID=A0A8H3CWK0_9AGAM|nr:unnamed protein product [Rhizoctonia solani]